MTDAHPYGPQTRVLTVADDDRLLDDETRFEVLFKGDSRRLTTLGVQREGWGRMVAKPRITNRARRMTVAEYDRLPDDGPRFELIDGELIEMPSPGWFHQLVLMAFVRFLDGFVFAQDVGTVCVAPFDVQLSDEVVQPNVFYVSRERRHIINRDRRASGAPDLVVEISSRSTRGNDLGDKRELYRQHGVREYWFIDVEALTTTVWALTGDRYVEQQPDADGLLGSTVINGFAVDMDRVFADAERQR